MEFVIGALVLWFAPGLVLISVIMVGMAVPPIGRFLAKCLYGELTPEPVLAEPSRRKVETERSLVVPESLSISPAPELEHAI